MLPDGEYPFTVLESAEIPSKSEKNKGKMMYAVKLNVHGPKGDHHCYDYFAPEWLSPWKVRHFAATTGQIKAYESGDFNGDNGAFVGKVGYVKIGTDPAKGKFSAKNVVKDYIARETVVQQPATQEDTSDIPF